MVFNLVLQLVMVNMVWVLGPLTSPPINMISGLVDVIFLIKE